MDVNLVMFRADGVRRDIILKRSESVLGRSEEVDLQIPLATVSRKHCTITFNDDDTIHVKDLGSSNGTFVNDKRVMEADVGPGDLVKIGPVIFTVQINGVPMTVEPTRTQLPADDAGEPVEHQIAGEHGTVDAEEETPVTLEGLPDESGVPAVRHEAAADLGIGLAEDEPVRGHGVNDPIEMSEPEPQVRAHAEEPAEEEVLDMLDEQDAHVEHEEEAEESSDPLSALAAMTKAKPKR